MSQITYFIPNIFDLELSGDFDLAWGFLIWTIGPTQANHFHMPQNHLQLLMS